MEGAAGAGMEAVKQKINRDDKEEIWRLVDAITGGGKSWARDSGREFFDTVDKHNERPSLETKARLELATVDLQDSDFIREHNSLVGSGEVDKKKLAQMLGVDPLELDRNDLEDFVADTLEAKFEVEE